MNERDACTIASNHIYDKKIIKMFFVIRIKKDQKPTILLLNILNLLSLLKIIPFKITKRSSFLIPRLIFDFNIYFWFIFIIRHVKLMRKASFI
jgi:hypothetical protein